MIRIEVHRQNTFNLKKFLEFFGFKILFGKINDNFDEVSVLPDDRTDLLEAIKAEVESTGYIPYHFSIFPNKKGKVYKDETVAFEGKVTQINDFQNVSGHFRLVLFEGKGYNYVWKCYGQNEFPSGLVSVTARPVATLKGMKGENLLLMNYTRIKEL